MLQGLELFCQITGAFIVALPLLFSDEKLKAGVSHIGQVSESKFLRDAIPELRWRNAVSNVLVLILGFCAAFILASLSIFSLSGEIDRHLNFKLLLLLIAMRFAVLQNEPVSIYKKAMVGAWWSSFVVWYLILPSLAKYVVTGMWLLFVLLMFITYAVKSFCDLLKAFGFFQTQRISRPIGLLGLFFIVIGLVLNYSTSP